MQRKILNKFNKQILCVLFLFIIIYTMFCLIPELMVESYAKTYTYSKNSDNLPTNFEKTYPGYKSLLETLAKDHPNWTFKLYETGLEWEEVINSEYQGHGDSPSNLVPSDYSKVWKCSICGTRNYDSTGRWHCASIGSIEYAIDPRNTLNESYIFQYLLLSNDENITEEQVATMAKKISYLNNDKLIKAIYEVANHPDYNINPFYIIGKILQEQGAGASALCSGQGYKDQYVGYYNLFNIGATGDGDEEVILNGLKYAKKMGWNTPQKAIMGGIGLVKDYIYRGQDTLYYQKYNVTYTPYYKNQYAQNIFDARSIGTILKGYYNEAELLDSEFIFEIPLFKNMPKTASGKPTKITETGERAYINANGGLSLRATVNGNPLIYVSKGTEILITKRATKKVGGYYWDKVSTPNGIGYMARESEDGTKTYLVVIKEEEPKEDEVKKEYEIVVENIIIAPDATIKDIAGATNSSKVFGTGAEIKLEDKTYTLVMRGDVNGDGIINSGDLMRLQKHFLKVISLKDTPYLEASDANKDKQVNSGDLLKIQKHLLKVTKITF